MQNILYFFMFSWESPIETCAKVNKWCFMPLMCQMHHAGKHLIKHSDVSESELTFMTHHNSQMKGGVSCKTNNTESFTTRTNPNWAIIQQKLQQHVLLYLFSVTEILLYSCYIFRLGYITLRVWICFYLNLKFLLCVFVIFIFIFKYVCIAFIHFNFCFVNHNYKTAVMHVQRSSLILYENVNR